PPESYHSAPTWRTIRSANGPQVARKRSANGPTDRLQDRPADTEKTPDDLARHYRRHREARPDSQPRIGFKTRPVSVRVRPGAPPTTSANTRISRKHRESRSANGPQTPTAGPPGP